MVLLLFCHNWFLVNSLNRLFFIIICLIIILILILRLVKELGFRLVLLLLNLWLMRIYLFFLLLVMKR